jgi:hypothetical protein
VIFARTILAAAMAAATPGVAAVDLARGDAAWAERADGQVDGRPRPEPIGAAIAAYEEAAADASERLDVRWKLLRALWFSSEFGGDGAAATRALLERARVVSDGALALVAARAGGENALARTTPGTLRAALPAADVADVARVYFWSAITLGAWSRQAGLLAAVRAGVAGRLRDYTERAVALDPAIDQGGPLRLLSRLHAEVPRVPFLSGWVDPGQSLPLAERAYAIDPGHPGNRYVLGMALVEAGTTRRDEGLRLIEQAATFAPRPAHLLEELAVRRDAAARLARERTRRP